MPRVVSPAGSSSVKAGPPRRRRSPRVSSTGRSALCFQMASTTTCRWSPPYCPSIPRSIRTFRRCWARPPRSRFRVYRSTAPIGAARVGWKDGKYLLNPTNKDLTTSDLHLVVAGTENAVLMVESEAEGLSEEVMLGSVVFGHEQMQIAIKAIKEIAAEAGKPRWTWQPTADDPDLVSAVALHAQAALGPGIYDHREAAASVPGQRDQRRRRPRLSRAASPRSGTKTRSTPYCTSSKATSCASAC